MRHRLRLIAHIAASTCAVIACGGSPSRIHDAMTLPQTFTMCGRTWTKDALERQPSLGSIRSAIGVEPVVLDPGLLTTCPTGPCTAQPGESPCHTVVYVRVGDEDSAPRRLGG